MPSLEQVKEQLKAAGARVNLLGKGEAKFLPEVLEPDERVEAFVQGLYANRNGALVATDRRILFVAKGIFSSRVEDFRYDKVTSIQEDVGLIKGAIRILAAGNTAVIGNVRKDDVRSFAARARPHLGKPATGTPSPSGTSRMAQLERLAQLRQQGALTPQEFEAEKRRLLAGR